MRYHKTYVLCWARSWVWTPQELLSNTRALHLWDWRREGKGWKGKGEGGLGEKEGPLTSGTGENIEKAGQPGSTIRSLAFLKAHFINCRMRPEHTGSDGVDYREIWREFRWYHDGVGDFIDDHTRSTCWLVHLIPVAVCWLYVAMKVPVTLITTIPESREMLVLNFWLRQPLPWGWHLAWIIGFCLPNNGEKKEMTCGAASVNLCLAGVDNSSI